MWPLLMPVYIARMILLVNISALLQTLAVHNSIWEKVVYVAWDMTPAFGM